MATKPGRFDSGIQMSLGTASWNGTTGTGGLYYKTGVGLVMRKTDNTEVTLGAGSVSWPLTNGTTTNTYTSAIADGAAAVAHDFNTTNAFATDGDIVARFGSNSAYWFTIGRSNAARKFTFFGDADSSGNGPVLVKSTASSAGVTMDATTAGGRIYQVYSTSAGLFNLADITAGLNRWQLDSNGNWSPSADGSYDLGISATNRVRVGYIKRVEALQLTSAKQNLSAAASLTLDTTLGGWIRILLSATAITTLTINAGTDGEIITVAVIQDATGTRSIPTTWTNVSFAGGTYTATTTANKRDLLTFRYDSTAAKWHEMARAMNI